MADDKSGIQAGDKAGDGDGTDDSKKDQGDAGAGDGDEGKAKGKAGADGADGAEKLVPQSQVDRILKKEKAKWESSKDQTEAERIKAENEELKKDKRERDSFDAFEVSAKAAGAANAKALFKLMKDDLEIDDSGKIKNLSDVVKEAKKEYPELFKKAEGGGDGGSGGKKPASAGMNDWMRSQVSRS